MPNYCENDLNIIGSKEVIAKFIEKYMEVDLMGPLKNTHGVFNSYAIMHSLDFEKIKPTPLKEDGEPIDNWYIWRLANWGTKWNCDGTAMSIKDYDKNNLILSMAFTTAWTPPHELMQYLSNIEPEIKIQLKYYEPGCCFAGEYEYQKGEITLNDYVEYQECQDNTEYYAYLFEHGLESMDSVYDYIGDKIEDEDKGDKIYNDIVEAIDKEDYVKAGDIYQKVVLSEEIE